LTGTKRWKEFLINYQRRIRYCIIRIHYIQIKKDKFSLSEIIYLTTYYAFSNIKRRKIKYAEYHENIRGISCISRFIIFYEYIFIFRFPRYKRKKITITGENMRKNVTFFRSTALFHDSFVISFSIEDTSGFIEVVSAHRRWTIKERFHKL